jgi:hypothetical protein
VNVVVAALIVCAAAIVAWRRAAMPRPLRISFVIGALVLAAYSFSMPAGVFSGDEGSKLVQVMALADGHVAIDYPTSAIDPARTAFPFQPPFALEAGGSHYGVYAVTFTAPTVIGWELFGWWGAYVLPLVGGLLVSWFTLALAWRAFASARWALACQALLFATPVMLNASLFNEHCLAAGLVMFALATALPADGARSSRAALIAAGFAFGWAVSMRLELVALSPAAAMFLLATAQRDGLRRLGWAAVGAVVPIAIYAVVNLVTLGLPTPVLDPVYKALFSIQRRNDDLRPTGGLAVGVYILAWPLALGFFKFPWRWLEHARLVALATTLGIWMYSCIDFYARTDLFKQPPSAFFLATPIFALALARGPYLRDPADRVAWLCWCFAIAGTASLLVFIPHDGGGRLGARFLVPTMPLWVIATVAVARSSRVFAAIAVATGLLTLWPLYLNHELHVGVRSRNAAVVDEVAAQPHRYVSAYHFWKPQILAPLHGKKLIFDGNHYDSLIYSIKKSGETAIIEVNGPSVPRFGLGTPVKIEGSGRVQVTPITLP